MLKKLMVLLIGFSLAACSPAIHLDVNTVYKVVDVTTMPNGNSAMWARPMNKKDKAIILWSQHPYPEGTVFVLMPETYEN